MDMKGVVKSTTEGCRGGMEERSIEGFLFVKMDSQSDDV